MSRTTPVEGSPKPREIVHGDDPAPEKKAARKKAAKKTNQQAEE